MPAVPYKSDQPAAKVHASLQRSLAAMDDAHQYAIRKLGFSKSRADDFIRLARQLDNLPAVREAVASGELGYTKAREIVSVATPETENAWLKAAKGTRKELPVRFQMDLTPEQEARRSAMVERLHKLGGVPNDRADLMLEALAALLKTKELQGQKCPRGHFPSRPPVQIHIQENVETGFMTVQSDAGERELSRAEAERMRCDAAACKQGGRNTTTIPPRVRREVLARDKHRHPDRELAPMGVQGLFSKRWNLWIFSSFSGV